MSLHPSTIQAIEVAARFGFINDKLFWDFICSTKRAMAFRQWRKIKDSPYFAPIESSVGLNNYLKLTRAGRTNALGSSLVPMRVPFLQQIAHDELLVRFALANEKAGHINTALPESYLKASPYDFLNAFNGLQKKIPDLYCSLNVGDKKIRVAMEYERTRKTQSRYRSILMSYAAFKDAELVLFIVNDEAIEKTIRGTAAKIGYPVKNKPLAFAYANDVEKRPSEFPLRLQNRTIEFHKFVQELRDIRGETA